MMRKDKINYYERRLRGVKKQLVRAREEYKTAVWFSRCFPKDTFHELDTDYDYAIKKGQNVERLEGLRDKLTEKLTSLL